MSGSGTCRIVPFVPAQADEVVRMWRESFEAAVVRNPYSIEEHKRYLLERVVPDYDLRVAWHERYIVGFIAASSESVAQLYVHRDYQRRGIGTRLLEWAKANSAGSLWLYTFALNIGAQRFYERRGFRIVSRGFEPEWQLPDIRYEWTREVPLSA